MARRSPCTSTPWFSRWVFMLLDKRRLARAGPTPPLDALRNQVPRHDQPHFPTAEAATDRRIEHPTDARGRVCHLRDPFLGVRITIAVAPSFSLYRTGFFSALTCHGFYPPSLAALQGLAISQGQARTTERLATGGAHQPRILYKYYGLWMQSTPHFPIVL